MGSMLAARQAGYPPNRTPIDPEMPNDKMSDPRVISVGIPVNSVTTHGIKAPNRIPTIPPVKVNIIVSVKN